MVGQSVPMPFLSTIVLTFDTQSPAILIKWRIWYTTSVNIGNQFMLTLECEVFLWFAFHFHQDWGPTLMIFCHKWELGIGRTHICCKFVWQHFFMCEKFYFISWIFILEALCEWTIIGLYGPHYTTFEEWCSSAMIRTILPMIMRVTPTWCYSEYHKTTSATSPLPPTNVEIHSFLIPASKMITALSPTSI